MNSVASLLLLRATTNPESQWGTRQQASDFRVLVERGAGLTDRLQACGIQSGDRVALIGTNCYEYLVGWIASVLGGFEVALTNPQYPTSMIESMLSDIQPRAVLWTRDADQSVHPGLHVDIRDETQRAGLDRRFAGLDRGERDTVGYMHTSGTTGTPKYCAQSNRYFLRLGGCIASFMTLTADDVSYVPLPLHHVNPLGYGVMGSLTAGCGVRVAERFSASGFWDEVIEVGATTVFLHAPPIAILRARTTAADSAGHSLRSAFFGTPSFLHQFGIAEGVSAYGSTEAAGVTNLRAWREGEDEPDGPIPASRLAGDARCDVEVRVADDGEILVREREPGVLFSGYVRAGTLEPRGDTNGWFHTGDHGRVQPDGTLAFIERRSESIRVKGEYVPIDLVEEAFARLPGVEDLCIWKQASDLIDEEVVLHVVCTVIPRAEIVEVASALTPFMRPVKVVRHLSIPRDPSVGKARRSLLNEVDALEVWAVSG